MKKIILAFACFAPLSLQIAQGALGLPFDRLIQILNDKERSLCSFFQKGHDEVLDSSFGPYPQRYTALPTEMLRAMQDVSGAQKFLVVFSATTLVKVAVTTDNQIDSAQGLLIMKGLHAYMNYADYTYCNLEQLNEQEGRVYAGFVYLFPDGSLLIHNPESVDSTDVPLGHYLYNDTVATRQAGCSLQ